VEENGLLLTMESMKMLTTVISPLEGVVKELAVKPGQNVKRGDLLAKIKPKTTKDKTK
jgi:biotin carboxyl carrier protein